MYPSPAASPRPAAVARFGRRRFAAGVLLALVSAVTGCADYPATTVNVDAAANRHPINPNIYGVNYGETADLAALNAPLNRSGGNATSRYNWQLDAHASGADWYFETYPDSSGTPSASTDAFIDKTHAAPKGAEPMLTIPLLDHLANLGPGRSTLAGFSVKKYGAQQKTDPWNADAGNGINAATGKDITGNDPADTSAPNSPALQQEWVRHLVGKYGPATSATGIKYYILDNEYSVWRATHRDVHPDPVTYDEIFAKIVAYATAIRAADPTARICAGEEYSWWAMYYSGLDQAKGTDPANSDYNLHHQVYFYPWLLQQVQAYKQQHGVQLIDVLTVHGYNDGPGDNDEAATQAQRNRQTRILWDPTFPDPFWFGDVGVAGRSGRTVNWIPTMKAWINQYCPGLLLGITEYNWGDEAHLNGATTQADVLGIYGREGVDLATRWTVAKQWDSSPTVYHVTHLASVIYRNYDGKNSTFGETSVAATVANPDNLSAFAAVRADGALTVMVINKQPGSTPVTVNLANFNPGTAAEAWQINAETQKSIAQLGDVAVANHALSTTVPAQSVTLFVVAAAAPEMPAPTPPAPTPSGSPSTPVGSGTTGGSSSGGGGGGAVSPWFFAALATLALLRRGIASRAAATARRHSQDL
ncbi:MAG TPA: glycoside hydrolase family 44 protein [Lacunisphaera sp.]|jgi:hypothetical protein|nr:glycoside hydrolase family 44 protein [Lacunisphaera sp.]